MRGLITGGRNGRFEGRRRRVGREEKGERKEKGEL